MLLDAGLGGSGLVLIWSCECNAGGLGLDGGFWLDELVSGGLV